MAVGDAWPAPAKLNLLLRVVGRRADGYHELQTVFQFLDVCDWLRFEPQDDGKIRRRAELPGVAAADDLVTRAAHALRAVCPSAAGVTIDLDKRLPMGGGLGGGSSDAATTLVALNHIWGCGLSLQRLAAIGLSLGADVPVFVHGYAAWAEGVGECLQPIAPPTPYYLVIHPGCHVATRDIFQDPELTRNSARTTIRALVDGDVGNDCLAVVARRYPEVRAALDWLQQHASARLTGTGACVFAAFTEQAAAQAVLAQLPAEFSGFVARGLNRSPLHERLMRADGT